MGSRTRLSSSLSVNTAGPDPNITLETNEGQFDDMEYCTKVIYSGSNQDSDTGENEDGRRGQERCERLPAASLTPI